MLVISLKCRCVWDISLVIGCLGFLVSLCGYMGICRVSFYRSVYILVGGRWGSGHYVSIRVLVLTGSLYVPCLRVARLFVSRTAIVDKGLNEHVCSVTEDELRSHLLEELGGVDWRVVYMFCRGDVLRDGKGRGVLDRLLFEEDIVVG